MFKISSILSHIITNLNSCVLYKLVLFSTMMWLVINPLNTLSIRNNIWNYLGNFYTLKINHKMYKAENYSWLTKKLCLIMFGVLQNYIVLYFMSQNILCSNINNFLYHKFPSSANFWEFSFSTAINWPSIFHIKYESERLYITRTAHHQLRYSII